VAEVLGLKLSGFIAWLMWRGLYLLRIPTLARKARLFLEWNWAMFFPPDISHLGYRRTLRHSPEVLRATQPPAPAAKPASNG
jgi:NADH dehydrogenase